MQRLVTILGLLIIAALFIYHEVGAVRSGHEHLRDDSSEPNDGSAHTAAAGGHINSDQAHGTGHTGSHEHHHTEDEIHHHGDIGISPLKGESHATEDNDESSHDTHHHHHSHEGAWHHEDNEQHPHPTSKQVIR